MIERPANDRYSFKRVDPPFFNIDTIDTTWEVEGIFLFFESAAEILVVEPDSEDNDGLSESDSGEDWWELSEGVTVVAFAIFDYDLYPWV